ncbi:hypothetical protein ACFCX0_13770 [Streptomyces sp. NPDC056352]|uniref:hypothetical protein n=1 Tax=Streptomyces sp. NPDC056352 TaxID=3345791 RepID=UPI0035D715DB
MSPTAKTTRPVRHIVRWTAQAPSSDPYPLEPLTGRPDRNAFREKISESAGSTHGRHPYRGVVVPRTRIADPGGPCAADRL